MKSIKRVFENSKLQEGLIEIAPILFTLSIGIIALIVNYVEHELISLFLILLTISDLAEHCYTFSTFKNRWQKLFFCLVTLGLTVAITGLLASRYFTARQEIQDELTQSADSKKAYIRGIVHATQLTEKPSICHTQQGNYSIIFEQEQPFIVTPDKQKLLVDFLYPSDDFTHFSSDKRHYTVEIDYRNHACYVTLPNNSKIYKGNLIQAGNKNSAYIDDY